MESTEDDGGEKKSINKLKRVFDRAKLIGKGLSEENSKLLM
jgi:hypothetical protein